MEGVEFCHFTGMILCPSQGSLNDKQHVAANPGRRTTGLVWPPVQSTQASGVRATLARAGAGDLSSQRAPTLPEAQAQDVPRKASANSRTDSGMVADQNCAGS